LPIIEFTTNPRKGKSGMSAISVEVAGFTI
jgi:hypothetical protein